LRQRMVRTERLEYRLLYNIRINQQVNTIQMLAFSVETGILWSVCQ
jgi:hypothetical protein